MTSTNRFQSRWWLLLLAAALAYVLWADGRRAQRVENVTAQVESAPPGDPASLSGYAGGGRQLVIPEHNVASFQWIAQTQQMFATRAWHVRHVDYDNAPIGREVRTTSPYRWWLGLISSVDRSGTGHPIGQSVERAALWADPVLLLAALAFATVFVWRRINAFAAAFVSVGLVALYPLAGAFSPGQPDSLALVLVLAFGSQLVLLLAIAPAARGAEGDRSSGFVTAGVLAGMLMWVDLSVGFPLIVSVAVGGLLARRWIPGATALPWRWWALGGAITVLLAYVAEYAPDFSQSRPLEAVHPWYGLVWLALGELLVNGAGGAADGGAKPRWRTLGRMAGLAAILVSLPLLLWWQHSRGFLVTDLSASRLSGFAYSVTARHVGEWLSRDGMGVAMIATLAPLGLLGLGVWAVRERMLDPARRVALVVGVSGAALALGFACARLRDWAWVDAMLLPVGCVVLGRRETRPGPGPIVWLATLLAVALVSLVPAFPRASARVEEGVTPTEVQSLVERDLAHWLKRRAGAGAIVLCPPDLAAALCYYGGVRALSTPYLENIDGFTAAVRIAGVAQPDEAHALVRRRQITHILLPSWDETLDEYARIGGSQTGASLIGLLHQWLPPRWLRPVPYQLPQIPGFEKHGIAIFEVGEVQDEPTALATLAGYFVETGDLDNAGKVADALAHYFPDDTGALIARAVVERARRNTVGLERVMTALSAKLTGGSDENLAWDARVMLSLVLAEARRFEPAREQLRRAFAEMDDAKLRSLTTGTLYRLQVLARVLRLPMPNAKLQQTAGELLPADLREQLGAPPAN